VVGGYAVHVYGLLGYSAEEVTSADDDADLAAKCVNCGYFCGYLMDEYGVDAETFASGQSFAGDLEEDSFVHVRFKYRMERVGSSLDFGRTPPPFPLFL
jgi:hypothetical protein